MGAEVDFRVQVLKALMVSGSYTYTSSEVSSGEEGDWLRNVYQPEHQGRLSARQSFSEFFIRADISATSSVFTDLSEAASSMLSGNAFGDLRFGWKPRKVKYVEFSLGVNNVTDSRITFIKDRPLPGRTIQFQIIINTHE